MFFVEGGGFFYGIRMIVLGENIIVDDGGLIFVDGEGYNRYEYFVKGNDSRILIVDVWYVEFLLNCFILL